jgi:hypothetical protein
MLLYNIGCLERTFISRPDVNSEIGTDLNWFIRKDVDQTIAGRFLGNYEDGLGKTWHDQNHMQFFNDGKVPFPYLSDGMWFLELKGSASLYHRQPYQQYITCSIISQ